MGNALDRRRAGARLHLWHCKGSVSPWNPCQQLLSPGLLPKVHEGSRVTAQDMDLPMSQPHRSALRGFMDL